MLLNNLYVMFVDGLIVPSGLIYAPKGDRLNEIITALNDNKENKASFIGIRRHCLLTDGGGITTLIGFSGCPLQCKYCINKTCWDNSDSKRYTPTELYNEVKKDLLYFLATGGGIMFGGGEPALQSRFIAEFRKICDSRLHIYLETSLNIPIENLKELIPSVDAYVVDIKDMDSKVYSRYTGKSNRKMIRNLKYMVDNGYADKIEIRVPLIPGFNTEHNVENSITKLKVMGFTKLDRFTYKTIVQSNH